jgi:hypothetical protein
LANERCAPKTIGVRPDHLIATKHRLVPSLDLGKYLVQPVEHDSSTGVRTMASLFETLCNAHDGEAITALGREFGLTQTQAQAAVTALLPAISTGLKQSTTTPDGLDNLFSMMGQQQDLQQMYDDPGTAFGLNGVAAGNDALSVIFGSPDVSRAVVDQAQKFSGVSSDILKKTLPVLAGILVSGLMRSGSTGRSGAPGPTPSGGSLGDVLGQIFGRGIPGSADAPPDVGPQSPSPPSQHAPLPNDASRQPGSDGDLLGPILRELEKGIREGRIKPVIIGGGPVHIPIPSGQTAPMPSGSDAPQMPGGDIFGQILRDILGGAGRDPAQIPQERQGQSPQLKDLSDLSRGLRMMGGAGAAVFGDHFESGQDVDQSHMDNVQSNRFFGAQKS